MVSHIRSCGGRTGPSAKSDGELVRRSVFLKGSVREGAFPWPGLGIELPGVRLVEGQVNEHLRLLGVDLVVLVLVQIGNGFLLFSLKDELEAVRVDTLGLAAFFGFLVVDPQVGGLGEEVGPAVFTASMARKRRTGVRGIFIFGR